MQPIITVENLCKEYVTYQRGETLGETVKSLFSRKKLVVKAVNNVSFSISEGEIIGLLGENGAGKSTIIKMLSGVLFPTSGKIRVMEYEPFSQRSRYVGKIGAVFGQKSQLIWDIPPADSFALNKAVYGIEDKPFRERLEIMTELLSIADVIKKPTRVLSLGERMKCEFVMAMLHAPRVVFLDEPTIGVDLIAKDAIRGFVRDMNRQGVTFILTTHDLEDIERLARRVIIINHGEKVFEDSIEALGKHLGDTKTVKITMKTPIPENLTEKTGITLLSRGVKEMTLLTDISKLSVNDLIVYLSGMGEIADISIKEPGIESVIKSIYSGGL